VRRGVISALVAMALAGACSTGTDDPTALDSGTDRPESTTTTTTPTSTTSATTSTTRDGYDLDSLPPCDPQSGGYRTLPDWVLHDLPADMELVTGSTRIWTPEQVQGSVPTQYLLAELDDGTVVDTIQILGGDSSGPQSLLGDGSGTGSHPDTQRQLDRVRGRPGRVSSWASRGFPHGFQVAQWTEAGLGWRAASTELQVDELAAALDVLSIDADGVQDPTGRFELLGEGPAYPTGPQRSTHLELEQRDPDGVLTRQFSLEIEPPVPGSTGLDAVGVGANVTKDDGEWVMHDGKGLASGSTIPLPDGSHASIRAFGWRHDPEELAPATATAIVEALRPRREDDDELLRGVKPVRDPELPGQMATFCIEPR
jgi:hypothetical protein